MSTVAPIAADVATRDWLQSGMVVQLLQIPSPSAHTIQDRAEPTDTSTAAVQRCIGRGVFQADALLDGTTREWSSRLSLMTEVPLFDATGLRLGISSPQDNVREVGRALKQTCLHMQYTRVLHAKTVLLAWHQHTGHCTPMRKGGYLQMSMV